jgi:hypothetical protein
MEIALASKGSKGQFINRNSKTYILNNLTKHSSKFSSWRRT